MGTRPDAALSSNPAGGLHGAICARGKAIAFFFLGCPKCCSVPATPPSFPSACRVGANSLCPPHNVGLPPSIPPQPLTHSDAAVAQVGGHDEVTPLIHAHPLQPPVHAGDQPPDAHHAGHRGPSVVAGGEGTDPSAPGAEGQAATQGGLSSSLRLARSTRAEFVALQISSFSQKCAQISYPVARLMAGSVVPLLTLGSLPGLEFTVTKHPPALSQGTSLKFFPHLAGIGVPPPQPGINPALPAVQLHPRRWLSLIHI